MMYKHPIALTTLLFFAAWSIGLVSGSTFQSSSPIPASYNVSAEFFNYEADKICSDAIPLNTPFVFDATFVFEGVGKYFYPFPAVPPVDFQQLWVFDRTTKNQRWMLGTGDYLITPNVTYIKEVGTDNVNVIHGGYDNQLDGYSFLYKMGSMKDEQYGLVDIYGGGYSTDITSCYLPQPATVFVKPCTNSVVVLGVQAVREIPADIAGYPNSAKRFKGAVGGHFRATKIMSGVPDPSYFDVATFLGNHTTVGDYCSAVYLNDAKFKNYITLPRYVYPLKKNCYSPDECLPY
jgi:hypothetical protein